MIISSLSFLLRTEKAAPLYADIASACESGWDFSSRWFNGDDLKTIKTSSVLPVDLNSLLCWNEQLLAKFHGILGELWVVAFAVKCVVYLVVQTVKFYGDNTTIYWLYLGKDCSRIQMIYRDKC